MSLEQQLASYQRRVTEQLQQRLQHQSIQSSLQQAMCYSLFNGGKRIRPALVYLVNSALEGQLTDADAAACAIEAVHSYSLVHDDLPAMDDDDLRRGKATCHVQFDQATAILAGDALQCIAFQWLSSQQNDLAPHQQLQMISVLATASGDMGMVAGQAFDLAHVDQPLSLEQLENMHRCKTGALITAAIQLGILSANREISELSRQSLLDYGNAIGLAFQVQDDILDITADTATLGKPQGSDIAANKPTYPALLGLDGARMKLQQLYHQALDATECLGQRGAALRELAKYIVERNH
ncbi:MAG: polyprenyl synthetase family protein [Pseudomonadales bacterium]|nr:polyprenyl synthetase family protein [Pseudomonadales bacterium]NRA16061.1 polyprenyl synthetase family protein [Oceanospirillaceae bacterium]